MTFQRSVLYPVQSTAGLSRKLKPSYINFSNGFHCRVLRIDDLGAERYKFTFWKTNWLYR